MIVFQAKNYIEFVSYFLHDGRKRIPRGAVKALSDHLQCHPTFISQVLGEKAHFSHEQALRFCSHAQLSEKETEIFIFILDRDRAEMQKHGSISLVLWRSV